LKNTLTSVFVHNPIARTYQEAMYNTGLPVIVFGVEDIQKGYEGMKKRGVAFRKEPTKTEYGIEAVFEDTCGNLIQLYQAQSSSARTSGIDGNVSVTARISSNSAPEFFSPKRSYAFG
jgi:hypothetical protein